MPQCLAKKWDGQQCTLRALQGKKFCGNHLKGLRYGLHDVPSSTPAGEELLEPAQASHAAEEPVQAAQAEQGEQAAQAVHQAVASLEECLGQYDADMFFVPLGLELVGGISQYWSTTSSPAFKLFPERPGFLQLFHHPIGLFLEVPDSQLVQAFKLKVCQALYAAGGEVPLPTRHPLQNTYNGGCFSRGSLKMQWPAVRHALLSIGVERVYLGQYGGKYSLSDFQDVVLQSLDMQFDDSMALDLGWQKRDPNYIYLLGLPGGKAVFADVLEGCTCRAFIHPIFPGMVAEDEAASYGTLEIRFTGRAGTDKEKFIQVYSPVSHVIKGSGHYETKLPRTMKSLRSRKLGVLNLCDTLLAHSEKAGGIRFEIRLRSNLGASTWGEAISKGKHLMANLKAMVGGPILLKAIPMEFFRNFIAKEVAAAVDHKIFCGMRDTAPRPDQPLEQERFNSKVQMWGTMMANLGMVSGHFSRHIKNGKSCQNSPERAPMPDPPAAPAAAEEAEDEASGPEEQVDDPTAPPARDVDQDFNPKPETPNLKS